MNEARPRILIVDDDDLDAERVTRAFFGIDTSFVHARARSADELFARLRDDAPYDCILLDYILPGVTATELVPRLLIQYPHAPIVVLTGHGDERIAVELMKRGASDYVAKNDLCPERLERAIRHALTLASAKLEAKRADEALKDMLAIVSHDLRGPLNNLRLGLELVDHLEPRLRHSLHENISLLQRLVDDLVDLARLHNGHLELRRESTDLVALTADIVDAFLPQAQAKDIHLSLSRGHATRAPVDGHRLRQVLGNLISNALKFTPRGGAVRVSVSPLDDHVEIHIEDTGAGINAEDLSRIFKRFWSKDPKKAGLGLGLYISKAVIEAHGGTIDVRSTLGNGTSFGVCLPKE